mmetsp:Transcript_43251/g.144038  ORF Transcript_43251/g.144038 Transcript_43251/m.144038 type:complete len:203 (-) Transcript_43251:183-791(-)
MTCSRIRKGTDIEGALRCFPLLPSARFFIFGLRETASTVPIFRSRTRCLLYFETSSQHRMSHCRLNSSTLTGPWLGSGCCSPSDTPGGSFRAKTFGLRLGTAPVAFLQTMLSTAWGVFRASAGCHRLPLTEPRGAPGSSTRRRAAGARLAFAPPSASSPSSTSESSSLSSGSSYQSDLGSSASSSDMSHCFTTARGAKASSP